MLNQSTTNTCWEQAWKAFMEIKIQTENNTTREITQLGQISSAIISLKKLTLQLSMHILTFGEYTIGLSPAIFYLTHTK